MDMLLIRTNKEVVASGTLGPLPPRPLPTRVISHRFVAVPITVFLLTTERMSSPSTTATCRSADGEMFFQAPENLARNDSCGDAVRPQGRLLPDCFATWECLDLGGLL
jgi:hypothetical protein